jgi:hypothetical protein
MCDAGPRPEAFTGKAFSLRIDNLRHCMPSNVCMSGRYKRKCVHGEDLSMDIFAGCEFIERNDFEVSSALTLWAELLELAMNVFQTQL